MKKGTNKILNSVLDSSLRPDPQQAVKTIKNRTTYLQKFKEKSQNQRKSTRPALGRRAPRAPSDPSAPLRRSTTRNRTSRVGLSTVRVPGLLKKFSHFRFPTEDFYNNVPFRRLDVGLLNSFEATIRRYLRKGTSQKCWKPLVIRYSGRGGRGRRTPDAAVGVRDSTADNSGPSLGGRLLSADCVCGEFRDFLRKKKRIRSSGRKKTCPVVRGRKKSSKMGRPDQNSILEPPRGWKPTPWVLLSDVKLKNARNCDLTVFSVILVNNNGHRC
ncbi:hypothetical protein EVAR_65743_1 [Eumeta japonica]|uniref:Uncharacterized protein n=1 Tax=Eumeta variegata TaxID=151549 RepID=A0A4C1ZLC8_EUMVA|nr:hypothetical protein EVAR_65743_1 [Eumeta japonica]